MSVSDDILKRSADAYRRIRNTARFLLGNLHGFDPAVHLLPPEDMPVAGSWAMAKRASCSERICQAYDDYDFARVVSSAAEFLQQSTWARCIWT